MSIVADFAQLLDDPVALWNDKNGFTPSTWTSQPEFIGVFPATGEGAVLTWTVRREQFGDNQVAFGVQVNDAEEITYPVLSEQWCAMQETYHTSDLNFPGPNKVVFRVIPTPNATGKLWIGDVVLWYRKQI